MRKIKLQTKFFLSYFTLAVVLVFLLSGLFYRYASKLLLDREITLFTNSTTSFMNQTEQVIKDMDKVSINVGYSNLIKNKLGAAFDLNVSFDSLSSLTALLVAINGADIKVDQINLYDFEGHTIRVGLNTKVDKVLPQNMTWLKQTKNLGGSKYISYPYQTSIFSVNTTQPTWYISLYRIFYNQYGVEVGTIETVKKCKSIFKGITSYLNKDEYDTSVFVYDEKGRLLFPYNINCKDANFYDYYGILKDETNYISFSNPKNNTNELVAYETSEYTGWTYVLVQPQSVILMPVKKMTKYLAFIIFIILIVTICLYYTMSQRLLKPIKELRNIIHKTEIDTLGQQNNEMPKTNFYELKELNLAFQNMSSKLRKSMDDLLETKQQEIKSRSLALHSQVNPHFYYNTLSSIMILAENQKSDEIAVMCKNLSYIMRYITKSGEELVPISKEIDYVEKYLYCMKVRYQSSLNYKISIDESLMNVMVPKLIIQPFVENALKYGTDCLPPWSININSEITKEFWKINIIDSGNGFTKDSLELINERLQTASARNGLPDIGINGMGILNVYSRWKLYCGENMIFSVGNTEDSHGIITIGCKTKDFGGDHKTDEAK